MPKQVRHRPDWISSIAGPVVFGACYGAGLGLWPSLGFALLVTIGIGFRKRFGQTE
jgi:hypothetical protein